MATLLGSPPTPTSASLSGWSLVTSKTVTVLLSGLTLTRVLSSLVRATGLDCRGPSHVAPVPTSRPPRVGSPPHPVRGARKLVGENGTAAPARPIAAAIQWIRRSFILRTEPPKDSSGEARWLPGSPFQPIKKKACDEKSSRPALSFVGARTTPSARAFVYGDVCVRNPICALAVASNASAPRHLRPPS